MKGASGVSPRELKFRRRIDPPPPPSAPSSGDHRMAMVNTVPSECRHGPPPGWRRGWQGTAPRRRLPRPRCRLLRSSEGPLRQKTIDLLALDERFACAHNSGCILLILVQFLDAFCIVGPTWAAFR